MIKQISLILLAVLIGGCSFMPKYSRPTAPVAPHWPKDPYGTAANTDAVQNIGWRGFFKDARLQKLIALALQNNRDLRVAALNVQKIRAQYRIGEASMLPTINGETSVTKERIPASASTKHETSTSSSYKVGLAITDYEIDFFGHLRSLKAQVLDNYFASEEARKNVQIVLVSEVAVQYMTGLELDEQLKVTQQAFIAAQAYYKVIKSSYGIGNASALDLSSVEVQVQTARANAAGYQRQRAQAENSLVLLIGGSLPDDLPSAQSLNELDFLSDLPAGLPSDLLARRPDILQAENNLKAANANVGVARAAFFPKITLTGSAGFSSIQLTDLFTGPLAWKFAPQLTVPLFDFGVNKANLDVAQLGKVIEVAQYEKAIQTAFREVADGLSARATFNEQVEAQKALVQAQQKRYDLADVRYRNGVDSYLAVLTAQQDLYSAQQSLIQSQFNRLSNLITLYKALGGGWQE